MTSIFESDEPPMVFDLSYIRRIAPFSLEELQVALKPMSRGRCKDKAGICLEMITNGGDELHTCLVEVYNSMLQTGQMDPEWKETIFTLLPKKGDLTNPGNWRPVAVLRV